ncbi:MAG: iron-containing redox enzyme family protein [Pseudomonadota bacterium]
MQTTNNELDTQAFHIRLAKYNTARLEISSSVTTWENDELAAFEHRMLQGRYLEEQRTAIAAMVPQHTHSADHFARWLESLAEFGPGNHHPLFDWLANDATLTQMKWFLTQEIIVETGFGDLLSCTQIGLPEQAKLECARNYWDEMGRGKPGATNNVLLNRMIDGLNLKSCIDSTVTESLARSNMMLGLATTRRYTYQSLGALGVAELTAPQRTAKVSLGMQRLGLSPWIRSFYDLNTALNVAHQRSWMAEIIHPLVAANPECAQFIAEGALMRLHGDQLCFNRYSAELGMTKNRHTPNPLSPRATKAQLEPQVLLCI